MNPKCPACGAGSWKNGFSRSGRRVYKCKSCGKKFNERSGTPLKETGLSPQELKKTS